MRQSPGGVLVWDKYFIIVSITLRVCFTAFFLCANMFNNIPFEWNEIIEIGTHPRCKLIELNSRSTLCSIRDYK